MQMRLRVYVHRNLRHQVQDVTYNGENTGLMGVVANKGGYVGWVGRWGLAQSY